MNDAKGSAGGGFIVRTAAGSAAPEEVRADVEFLTRTWSEIKARSEQRKAPSLLHRDLNLVERMLRDHMSSDYTAMWVDSEEEYTKVVDFMSRFQPALVSRVKLYTKETPVFEEFGIQQEIDKGLRPKVWLKSGGYIVINHTEALVAIDVNTGKFVGKGSNRLEDTIVRTNLEAVKEIVRQMRLRDLGGIIVIDFIDMEERRNREKVMAALEDALRADRAPSKVLRFNEFGLVAITRKRTKQALERTLCQPCPYCTGSGMVKSVPDAVLRNSDRSAQDGAGNGVGQHYAARPSRNCQGAEDARVVIDRGARALDQKERDHSGRSHASLGAVRYLLEASCWRLEARGKSNTTLWHRHSCLCGCYCMADSRAQARVPVPRKSISPQEKVPPVRSFSYFTRTYKFGRETPVNRDLAATF